MSDDSRQFQLLKALQELAGAAGNQKLRTALGWDEDTYAAVRDALVAAGRLAKGRGRGGSVLLIEGSTGGSDAVVGTNTPAAEDGDEAAAGATGLPSGDFPEVEEGFGQRRKGGKHAQVLAYRHPDRRVNNPEVGMVQPENDPDTAKTRWAYDPHLDPVLQFDIGRSSIEKLIDEALESGEPERMHSALEELKRLQSPYLTWTGKAERTSFEVDTVSLHVHERIDPATILRAVKKRVEEGDGFSEVEQMELFAPAFERKPLREALDFYQHDKNWSNRLVAGDSLLVMNSLLKKEGMAGQVQMIYIDPPYGIRYGSNFQPFVGKRDVKDRDVDLTQEPEMIKAFRDTWELGIHSYLTYLRDRLRLAWELLGETGSIFVQIGDENVHRARAVMEEIFGESNFVSEIVFQTTSGAGSPAIGTNVLAKTCDYIIWFAKNKDRIKYRQIYTEKNIDSDRGARFRRIQTSDFHRRPMMKGERDSISDFPAGTRIYRHDNLTSQSGGPTTQFDIAIDGIKFMAGSSYWKTNELGMSRLSKSWRLGYPTDQSISFVRFIDDFAASPISNTWTDVRTGAFTDDKSYVVQTATKVLQRCILMTTDPGDLVLDPTCGSGTTAYAAEQLGRRWITCDTSRVAVTLAKQRLMTGSFDYYVLRYPPEGLKGGFTYRTVPHVTLKSIANNPDIDTIYADHLPKIAVALESLNAALSGAPLRHRPTRGPRKGQWVDFSGPGEAAKLHADEVPESFPNHWPDAAAKPHSDFKKARKRGGADRSLAELNAALKNAALCHRAPTGGRKGELIDFCLPDSVTTNVNATEETEAWCLLPGECIGPLPNGWPAELELLWVAAASDTRKLDELNLELRGKKLAFTTAEGWKPGRDVKFDAPKESRHYRIVDRGVRMNSLLEWEVPCDFPEYWPEAARAPFNAFHAARQAMQARMDQSVADRAEPEQLYDQPERDPSRLRVTGPFTVEAVPAPTVLSLDETRPMEEADATVSRSGETSRQSMWRGELMKTGIRGKGGRMLRFAELEALPGLKHLHASGCLAETGERVVVSFGPEHAALEQRQVALALDEAETLRPSPKLVVFCAFTFDPEAAKDIDETNWPGVALLKAQMNTDLLTEDLKRARSSNQSFWLMGQPDVDLRRREDGRWEVEVRGFDYFDPIKGDLVFGGTRNIAMWTLDTDYDQRSLYAHQVFFPMVGEEDGWNRLRKTIRAELDDDLLEQFHGTVSLPFEAGDHRRVAVKIVDDRGIESLKILPLDA